MCFAHKELIAVFTVVKESHRWNDTTTRYVNYITTAIASCCCSACLNSFFGKLSEVPIPPGFFLFPPTVFFRLLPSVGYHAFPSSFPLFPYHSLSSLLLLAGVPWWMPPGRTRPKVAFGKQDRIAFLVVGSRVTVPWPDTSGRHVSRSARRTSVSRSAFSVS